MAALPVPRKRARDDVIFDQKIKGTPEAVHQARHALTAALPPDAPAARIALIAAELMANAIQHSCSRDRTFRLSAIMRGAKVRVSVIDRGGGTVPAQPHQIRRGDRLDAHGRGLPIIRELSDDWGVISRESRDARFCETWATVLAAQEEERHP